MAQAFNRGDFPLKNPPLPFFLFPTFYAILLSLMNTEHLNPEQAKAVNTINGPVLIIAGTAVLTDARDYV